MTVANINIKQVLLKRGNTAVSETYIGPVGEVTIDTDLQTLRIHDGVTYGGHMFMVNNRRFEELLAQVEADEANIANLQEVTTTISSDLEAVTQDLAAEVTNSREYTDSAITTLLNTTPGLLNAIQQIAEELSNDTSAVNTIFDRLTSLNNDITSVNQDAIAANLATSNRITNVVTTIGNQINTDISNLTTYIDQQDSDIQSNIADVITQLQSYTDDAIGNINLNPFDQDLNTTNNVAFTEVRSDRLQFNSGASVSEQSDGDGRYDIVVDAEKNLVVKTNEASMEWVFDINGTLTVPGPTTSVFTLTFGEWNYVPTGNKPTITLTNAPWELHGEYQYNANGDCELLLDNIWPIPTNPGYESGDSFTFDSSVHGIPGYTLTITLNNVVMAGPAGWTANVGATQPPAYPSTFISQGAIRLTANESNWTFGTNGALTLPVNGDILDAYGNSVLGGSSPAHLVSPNGEFEVTLDNTGAVVLSSYGVIKNFDHVNLVSDGWVQMQWVDNETLTSADPNSTSGPTNWIYVDQNGIHVETNINGNINDSTSRHDWLFDIYGGLISPEDGTVNTSNLIAQNVYTDNYFYANGTPYTGGTGSVGYTGSAGTNGYTGSAGINGYTGSAGTNGYTGSAGTNGYTGSQGATGATGPGMTYASGIVNAGTFVTLDNLKATLTGSSNRGLSLAAVTGSFSTLIGGTFAINSSTASGGSAGSLLVSTSASASVFSWNFIGAGDISTYIITDTTNSRAYRITLQIGSGYSNNMISIERLV